MNSIFREKKKQTNLCLFWVDGSQTLISASYLATLLWRKGDEGYFPPKLHVRIKDNNNSPHGKFHRFLYPFSSILSNQNFTSCALYIYPCYVTWQTPWAWVTCGKIFVLQKEWWKWTFWNRKKTFWEQILLSRRTVRFRTTLVASSLRKHSKNVNTSRKWRSSQTVKETTFPDELYGN